MKKKLRKYIILPLLAVLWLCGCGKKEETDKAETVPDTAAETESQTEETEETEEKEQERTQYPVSEADTETIYADREKNQELADFLIAYYQIPEEFCAETRYYYDMVDLNEDGTEEILAVVVGEYTECDGGDPAVILEQNAQGYQVLESFAYVRTPVYVSDAMSDGWHDLIFPAHGGEEGTGFRVFHYQDSVGYQNANMEFMDDMDENFCGRRIIADNFIDDMDKGNYLTLREPPLSGN